MLKAIFQVIVFIMELVMLYSFGFFAYKAGSNTLTHYTLAILLTAGCIILWGVFAAPKSAKRLNMPYLGLFRCGMFLTAALFLFLLDLKTMAIAMAALAVITQVASFYVEKD
ncbi:YrdB family protein [Danxiaibacter flavus]|uniref:YrdB family protein n=1 Tax=Danxiaibacter flavus TaxID=3049108 RepID=A0ABV3ZBE1_9BACT|nr:YrdB family protein [Chitinophagaceae bacterium DXS]